MRTRRPLWDVFCRVVDNHGDLGVAWRLAADLASRGVAVRLWVDEPAALGWMAPPGGSARDSVDVIRWTAEPPDLAPGDVAVETFGCDLPRRFLRRLAAGAATLWIDLEYLSAESYVERSHGLASPLAAAPGRTLKRRFYYPGFTARTGGLLREPGLLDARRHFDRSAWLAAAGITPQPGERLVSMFCYDSAPLAALPDALDAFDGRPTLLLAMPGTATAQLEGQLGSALRGGRLRVQKLDWLPQPDYDRLLWAGDLNFMRGEDSFVRAQWAGAPFVWQIYPQHDGAHAAKLTAFLDVLLAGADAALAAGLRHLFLRWNGLGDPGRPLAMPAEAPWRALCERWRESLAAQPDLTTQLLVFAERACAADRPTPSPAARGQ